MGFGSPAGALQRQVKLAAAMTPQQRQQRREELNLELAALEQADAAEGDDEEEDEMLVD